MKRIVLGILAFAAALSLSAQLPLADGFYRVKNIDTGRYITLIDDYGKIDYSSTDVDAGAIRTYRITGTNTAWDYTNVISNPASVLYSECTSTTNNSYIFYCQGCNTKSIIGYDLNLLYKNGGYRLYASSNGLTKYMNDSPNNDADSSYVETKGNTWTWDAMPLTANGDNYFGMYPTISCSGAYYLSFYAAFPFSFYSSGMTAYYINKVDAEKNVAVWKEITTQDIPAETPIIVKCSSDNPANNRLNIHKSTVSAITDNLLNGVYFCNIKRQTSNPHFDAIENNPETMRVLGVLSDGTIGLKKYGGQYFPKNTAYINVPAETADELKLMTQEEYEKMLSDIPVTSVTLNQTEAELGLGETLQLTATVLPENALNKTLTWTSSNISVATVNDGLITAVGKGTATITATTQDGTSLSATCEISVVSVYAESIYIDEEYVELTVGENYQLAASVGPSTTRNKEVNWTSSNPFVVSVSNKGVLNAFSPGEATITATTKDGTNLSSTCQVKVLPILVESVTLDYTEFSIEMTIQNTFQLNATVLPGNATDNSLTWTSSNEDVATVNSGGRVTVKSEGFAVITATANDGSGCSAKCNLTATDVINDINNTNPLSTEIYNLSGQKVDSNYKGIVIINGRKYLNK